MRHERVVVHTGVRSRLPIIVAIHSTVLGPAAGGVRMTTYADWRAGLEDALRLSEAMTLKCAIAGLPHGGGKAVIALAPGTRLDADGRRNAMLDLGDVIDTFAGTYLAGEDVGTTAEDMLIVRERTQWAYCLPESAGGTGEPSEPTAIGLYEAIRATLEHVHGLASPRGRHITVIGLGQVGGRLARLLAYDGAELTVTDIDPAKKSVALELGAAWVDVERAARVPADVLVPAAVGGLLTADLVPDLACSAICGPANNQLDSPAVAELLHKRGILWAPDFVVNSGGVLYSSLVETSDLPKEQALARVRGIGRQLSEILALAKREGLSPLAAAESVAYARLAAV